MKNEGLLSVVLLSYYSGKRLIDVHAKISSVLQQENISFELIIMDDGSMDESFMIAEELEAEYANVRAFQLSRNYTSHYSIFAGLSVATGDCVTIIPDDEQQPYSSIVDCYRLWQDGKKVIIPYRIERHDSLLERIWAVSFYKIMNALSDITLPPMGADVFFIDRELVNLINKNIHPINTTSITEVIRLGYDPFYLPYTRPAGINQKSRWTFKKKFRLAKDYFFSSSTFPIKLITSLGLFFSFFSLLLMSIYLYAKLFGNSNFWHLNDVPGWTSTISVITFFSGIILFSLGIIAEYIWRIYEEVKNRPGYVIKKNEKQRHNQKKYVNDESAVVRN